MFPGSFLTGLVRAFTSESQDGTTMGDTTTNTNGQTNYQGDQGTLCLSNTQDTFIYDMIIITWSTMTVSNIE